MSFQSEVRQGQKWLWSDTVPGPPTTVTGRWGEKQEEITQALDVLSTCGSHGDGGH